MWCALWGLSVIIISLLALRIVLMISAMPTVFVSLFCRPASGHTVYYTIHQIVYIFKFVLVGFPMRGSIGERIAPLCLLPRRRPRTLFSTHIGSSSRIVSARVVSGRESSRRAIPIRISRRVSRVMSWGRASSLRVKSMGSSRWRSSRRGSCAESVVCAWMRRWRAIWCVGVHDIQLLRCPKGTLKKKRKKKKGSNASC